VFVAGSYFVHACVRAARGYKSKDKCFTTSDLDEAEAAFLGACADAEEKVGKACPCLLRAFVVCAQA
jgi:hypothetical protein